ncbi:hypothetical protein DW352_24770 [Pseudolabrys taiwanensis]|uniref:Uncharacterized protein n=2 Tax=Pseudolabrys taiwanensis TaxID=331696 RepID=A0A346A2Q8_9HYPH|nr:hypothetical protein DW352_24770 [Pseudolabrys taiwanensis]
MRLPLHSLFMKKQRIIVTCPITNIAVITSLSFDDVAAPRQQPILFSCPCGETHKLQFAGRHADLNRPRPGDRQGAG